MIPEVVEKTENQLLKVLHTNTVFYTLYTFFHTHDARTNVKISDLSTIDDRNVGCSSMKYSPFQI